MTSSYWPYLFELGINAGFEANAFSPAGVPRVKFVHLRKLQLPRKRLGAYSPYV